MAAKRGLPGFLPVYFPALRINSVTLLEQAVEFGVPFAHLAWLFEKGFCRDCEELCMVGGAIVVQDGAPAFACTFFEFFEFFPERFSPGGKELGLGQLGCSFESRQFLVELVGKLVQGNVHAVGWITAPTHDRVPGQNHGSSVPGFAKSRLRLFRNDAEIIDILDAGPECTWIDEDRAEARVGRTGAVENQKAGLAGDGDNDLLGEFEAAAAFEIDAGNELGDLAVQGFLQLMGEA